AALEAAQAAVVLSDPTAAESDRLDAVRALIDRGDQEVKNLLRSARSGAPEALAKAMDAVVDVIEKRLALMQTAQN
ncbi:urea ABC transporter permease subunit UrtB, partial [bacterium]|nr:urea ABC transporter permease subunit UrtB [bacterium]